MKIGDLICGKLKVKGNQKIAKLLFDDDGGGTSGAAT